jgi:hypothetical protein
MEAYHLIIRRYTYGRKRDDGTFDEGVEFAIDAINDGNGRMCGPSLRVTTLEKALAAAGKMMKALEERDG